MIIRPTDTFDRDDRAVAKRLALLRWGNEDGDIVCPRCSRHMWRTTRDHRRWGCTTCNTTTSVTAGTTLSHTKLPLWKIWFLALNLAQEVRPSARALSRLLGIAYDTAWRWRHRLLSCVATLPTTLVGRLRSLSTRVPLQPPNHNTPPLHPDANKVLRDLVQHHRMATVTILGGDEGSWVIFCGERLLRHLESFTPSDIVPMLFQGDPEPRPILLRFADQVTHVLYGVSARWLLNYAQFAAKRAVLGIDTAEHLLSIALNEPKSTFDDLRPGSRPVTDVCLDFELYLPACLYPAGQGMKTYDRFAVTQAA